MTTSSPRRSPRATAGTTTRSPWAVTVKLIRDHHPHDGTALVDPFCGSGTSLVVALLLGIPCVGFDLDPLHAESAEARLKVVRATPAAQREIQIRQAIDKLVVEHGDLVRALRKLRPAGAMLGPDDLEATAQTLGQTIRATNYLGPGYADSLERWAADVAAEVRSTPQPSSRP